MKRHQDSQNKGIAALEVMAVVVALLAILTIAVPIFLNQSDINRVNLTSKKLTAIKYAIVGDHKKMVENSRSEFGFVGDLGILPDDTTVPAIPLIDLIENTGGKYPPFQQQNNIWYGWRGPYLETPMSSDQYVAIKDAWGRVIQFNLAAGVDPNNGKTRLREIRSTGADVTNPGDDIYIYVYEEDVSNFVSGDFLTAVTKSIITSYNGQLNIYYPGGTSLNPAVANITITNGEYDSDDPADINDIEIPVGHRYFETQDLQYFKVATLNGEGDSIVNFIGDEPVTPPGKFFERTFYPTDDTDGNPITQLMGTWSTDSLGNYYADGIQMEYRAVFGDPTWDDYRIEVDATLYQGQGYGIFYRSDGQPNITGYSFQYEPGLSAPGFMTFVVRKVINGVEQPPFQRLDVPLGVPPDVYNASHHISITVQGNQHIIKVDGSEIFNFTDSQFLVGQPGLRSWDGNHYADFHHLLVYDIPPLPTGEVVWWSFEEGGGDTVYGSGFLIGAAEINGTLADPAHVSRTWQIDHLYGQAMYMDGNSSGYIGFGDVLDYRATDAFTISLWIKMPAINPAQEYTAISKIRVTGNPGDPDVRGWILRLMQEPGYKFGAVFSLGRQIEASSERTLLNDLAVNGIQPNQWYHIAITYDGTAYGGNDPISANSMVIYVTPQTANVVTAPTLSVITETLRANHNTTNSGDLRIGSAVNFSSPFQGYIDEVRIYNHALSISEVNDVFQKHK
jgi:hypothetical protein